MQKYKLVQYLQANTQTTIRSCLLALSFDLTTLIEIAVYIYVETWLYKFVSVKLPREAQHWKGRCKVKKIASIRKAFVFGFRLNIFIISISF